MTAAASGVLVPAVALLLGFAWFGRGGRLEPRDLLEFGSVSVPKRLEDRAPDGSPERVIFTFDRVANSIFLMGSHTPVAERLVVAAIAPDLDADARRRVEGDIRVAAVERTEEIRWERAGDLEIGRGLHRVNNHETPAIVLRRAFPERGLALGYMVWEKDCRLDEARQRLDEIAGTFTPGLPLADFFRVERDRPAAISSARRAALEAWLGERDIRLLPDGPPVERAGVIHHLSDHGPDPKLGRPAGWWIFLLHPLGDLAPSPRGYWHLRPIPPDGMGNWPDVIYLQWKDGTWAVDGFDRVFEMAEPLRTYLASRQPDSARVYFYAVSGAAVEQADPSQWGVRYFDAPLPHLDRLFAEGKLVEPRE